MICSRLTPPVSGNKISQDLGFSSQMFQTHRGGLCTPASRNSSRVIHLAMPSFGSGIGVLRKQWLSKGEPQHFAKRGVRQGWSRGAISSGLSCVCSRLIRCHLHSQFMGSATSLTGCGLYHKTQACFLNSLPPSAIPGFSRLLSPAHCVERSVTPPKLEAVILISSYFPGILHSAQQKCQNTSAPH